MNAKNLIFNKITLAVLLLALAGGGYLLWQKIQGPAEPKYRTVEARKGNVTQSVSANGTLKPVVLVNVGTQVSGTVTKLHADFNDRVKQGQVLLELDPEVLNAQVRQTEANMSSARASLDLALANETRARTLFQQEYISRQEMDQATQAARAARAQVEQINAQMVKDKSNLSYTIIRSPVSGVVVSRAVDLGQTVAASFQTPTLFQIAQDLRKMQIDSAFAEADIGNIRPGQPVTFTVDAFPNLTFNTSVRQVRLNATTTQNVVTYNVVIGVDNPDEILRPSMTAYVSVILAQREDVLLVPNAALRFRPDATASGAQPRRSRADKADAPAKSDAGDVGDAADAPRVRAAPAAAEDSGAAGESGGGAEKSARRRSGQGGKSGFAGRRGAKGGEDSTAAKSAGAPNATGRSGDTQSERPRAVIFVMDAGQLRRVPIRPGITDGRFTEVVAGDLKPGDQIVTGVVDASSGPAGPAQGTFRMRLF